MTNVWEVLHGTCDTLGGLTNSTKNHSRYQGKVSVLKEQYWARKMQDARLGNIVRLEEGVSMLGEGGCCLPPDL